MNVVGKITTGTGRTVYFDPADTRGEHLARSHGVLAPFSLELWNVALRLARWDLVVDVGCNYGEMLVSAKLPASSRVVAFEPNPKVLPYLKRTLSEIGRPVELIDRAGADEPRDSAPFVIDEDWSGTSGFPRHLSEDAFGHDHRHTVTSVGVTTLDAQFASGQSASVCIKIDVEGYEHAVLTGARQLLTRAPHWAVVLEVLHMQEDTLAELAARHPIYVLPKDARGLVRLHSGDAGEIRRQIADDRLYPQDALMVSAPLHIQDNGDASLIPAHGIPARAGDGLNRTISRQAGRAHSSPRRVVYTAMMGSYEPLNEQPAAAGSTIDFICLTDDPQLVSDTWTVRVVAPRFPRDSIRSARYLKVMGPELLDDYDESLWIDNTIVLRMSPGPLLDEWLADGDLAVPLHSYRDSVAGEFDAVAAAGHDDAARIYEQLMTYAATRPAVLDEKPYATGVMARRHTGEVCAAMKLWYEHILRYCCRDQLSLNYVLSETGLAAAGIGIDIHESRFHQWRVGTPRRAHVTHGQLADVLDVPHAKIGRLENMVASLRTALATEESRCRQLQTSEAALLAALAEHEQERTPLEDLSAVNHELHLIKSSTSWRITRPVRWLGALLPDSARRTMRGMIGSVEDSHAASLPQQIHPLRARK